MSAILFLLTLKLLKNVIIELLKFILVLLGFTSLKDFNNNLQFGKKEVKESEEQHLCDATAKWHSPLNPVNRISWVYYFIKSKINPFLA